MKKIILSGLLLLSLNVSAADYTVNFTPADNSVSDQQVSLISVSKISNFVTSVSAMISSALNNYVLKSEIKVPTRQVFTSGSNLTYTTPSGVKWIRVRMVGGGGGGGGGGDGSNIIPGSGTASYFGTNLLVANGGAYGSTGTAGGLGGGGQINLPAVGEVIPGSGGGPGIGAGVAYPISGTGGASGIFGGGTPGSTNGIGSNAPANTGGGGGGASANGITSNVSGAGGGGGGGVDAWIYNPGATYSYTVGQRGLGAAKLSDTGYKGGDGAHGKIVVEEYYQ